MDIYTLFGRRISCSSLVQLQQVIHNSNIAGNHQSNNSFLSPIQKVWFCIQYQYLVDYYFGTFSCTNSSINININNKNNLSYWSEAQE